MLSAPPAPPPDVTAPDPLAPYGEPSARVRVRDALRRLVAAPDWPRASWTVRQNRLLDEVGSDLRPLVALLVRAGEGGVVDGLPASPAAWPAARGALVMTLTAHSFLLPEMARWAVECWGFAVGLVDEGGLTVAADPRVALWQEAERRAAARAAAERAAAERVAAQEAARRASAERTIAARATPAAKPTTPAGAASSMGTPPAAPPGRTAAAGVRTATWPAPQPVVTSAPAGRLAAPPTQRRGRLPAGLDNPVAHVSLAGICVFAGYVLYSAVRLPSARATEVRGAADAAAVAAPAVGGAPTSAPGIPGVTANGLPQSAEDSARMIRVVPARRPTDALDLAPGGGRGVAVTGPAVAGQAVAAPVRAIAAVAVPVAPASPPVAAPAPRPQLAAPPAQMAAIPTVPDGYDRLRLRDGRVLRGRVELVRVGTVVFRDADTGLRFEHPKADVDAVVTEFGTTVRFSPEEAPAAGRPGASAAERAAARLVRRGVGGRYQVTFSVLSVTGSPECQRGWRAAPPPDWARVTHVPGADTLAIAFEGGATFASVIDGEAQFASTFVIVPDQAYSGQALTTRLNGRFAEGGFDAAVNLVGYRRVSAGRDVACHTVLRAVGRLAAPPAVPRRG